MLSLPQGFGGFSRQYPESTIFSLQDLRDDDIEQNSPLLNLKDDLLDKILEYVPLKDRLLKVRPVCHRLSDSVKRSVKSVEFLRDELDYCDDAKISFFLAVYGKNVEHMNYDLFRSCSLREYTQWSWRQSVISSVTRCVQLKQLDILVCCRHRLRDGDLQVIFKQCNQLEVIRMDASFINGHCFAKAPQTLRKVELDCCQTLNKNGFLTMCNRLYRLQSLHVSLFNGIDEQVIKRVGEMKNLRNLSIVADPEQKMNQFRLAEIRKLPKLQTLCLDGVNNVTDKFLGDLCDPGASLALHSIEHLSIAWCKNIGPNGIAKLKNLPNLKSLNLDGVSKRDISTGLEAIGSVKLLERLLISEDTFVSPRTIVELVAGCDSLRTLDISGNCRLTEMEFAEKLYSGRANSSSSGKPLVVLTDCKSMWRNVAPYTYGTRVEIVNIADRYLDEEHFDSISPNTAQQLPRGYLIPDLRRGNRYKMFDFSLNTSGDLIDPAMFENQENRSPSSSTTSPLQQLTEMEQEQLVRMLMDMQPNAFQNQIQNTDWSDYGQENVAPVSSTTSFEDKITVGSAGAPGPPKNKNADKILKHSRPSRPKRQAQKERAQQRRSGISSNAQKSSSPMPTGPSFTDDDFPPLG